MCLLKILNGCVRFPDSGKFTFISDHGHSVVDYFLVNNAFCDFVEGLVVADRIESDHMPVEMICAGNLDSAKRNQNRVAPYKADKYVWCSDKLDSFVSCIFIE